MMPDSNYDFGNETKNSEITLCRWTCLTRMWICDFTNRFAVFFAKLRFVYCKCKTDQNKIFVLVIYAKYCLIFSEFTNVCYFIEWISAQILLNRQHSALNSRPLKLKAEKWKYQQCRNTSFWFWSMYWWSIFCASKLELKNNVQESSRLKVKCEKVRLNRLKWKA